MIHTKNYLYRHAVQWEEVLVAPVYTGSQCCGLGSASNRDVFTGFGHFFEERKIDAVLIGGEKICLHCNFFSIGILAC
jgi:hypothetical protein